MDRLKMLHALASPDLQGRGSGRVRHGKTSYLLITAAMHEVFWPTSFWNYACFSR